MKWQDGTPKSHNNPFNWKARTPTVKLDKPVNRRTRTREMNEDWSKGSARNGPVKTPGE